MQSNGNEAGRAASAEIERHQCYICHLRCLYKGFRSPFEVEKGVASGGQWKEEQAHILTHACSGHGLLGSEQTGNEVSVAALKAIGEISIPYGVHNIYVYIYISLETRSYMLQITSDMCSFSESEI